MIDENTARRRRLIAEVAGCLGSTPEARALAERLVLEGVPLGEARELFEQVRQSYSTKGAS